MESTTKQPAEHARAVDWAAVRARYPVATNSTFLNITSGTPLSNASKAAVDELIEAQWNGSGKRDDRLP